MTANHVESETNKILRAMDSYVTHCRMYVETN